MKKVLSTVKGAYNKVSRKISAFALAALAIMAVAAPAQAENPDLVTATGNLTTGVSDMKTQALVIIAAVIAVIVVVFGIGWLIGIVKRNMSKA